MKGHVVAKARGPIMISPEEGESEDLAGVLKRGRVLGGGVSLIERDMALYVRSNFRTYRNITRLADKIGQRFYAYDKYGLRETAGQSSNRSANPAEGSSPVQTQLPKVPAGHPEHSVPRNSGLSPNSPATPRA